MFLLVRAVFHGRRRAAEASRERTQLRAQRTQVVCGFATSALGPYVALTAARQHDRRKRTPRWH